MTPIHDDAMFDRNATLALAAEWNRQNGLIFSRTMKAPHFVLALDGTHLGVWMARTRTIEISRALIENERWGVVAEVLKHEMAHQFVHEVLRIVDETAHGPAFRHVCEARGIDARAKGTPAAEAEAKDDGGVKRRIAKLLALAGSPNEHEAASAAALARKLRLKHRLEASAVDQRYSWKQLGPLLTRMTEVDRWLASILAQHAFVDTIFVSSLNPRTLESGRVLEVCGTDDDLEFAEWMYIYLRRTAERLADDHVKRQGGGRRSAYMAGVLAGVRDSLKASAAIVDETGVALVWTGDPQLEAFVARRYPRTVSIRRSSAQSSEDRQAGREAGRRVTLHRPIGENTASFGGFLGR